MDVKKILDKINYLKEKEIDRYLEKIIFTNLIKTKDLNRILKKLEIQEKILIIGNGDAKNIQNANEIVSENNLDGYMLGRAVFTNPWAFNKDVKDIDGKFWNSKEKRFYTKNDKIELFTKHLKLWQKTWEDQKNINIVKKYCKIYINGFDGATKLRLKIMEANSIKEILSYL